MLNIDLKKTLSKFVNNIAKKQKVHHFIEENDNVLIGLSGGKDSLLLLEILGELKKRINFNFIPVHIKITDVGYSIDLQFLEELCITYQTRLKVIESHIDFDPNNKKGPCFICSWHRRKQLFSLAKELNCNKLALGHHMDDAVQTLLLNMVYHGSISSMPARLSMFNGTLDLIRPLLFLKEDEIISYQKIRKYPELIKDCPYGSDTQRNKMKEIISSLEQIHPQAKENIFKAMSRIYTAYLPEGEKGIVNGLNVIHPILPTKD